MPNGEGAGLTRASMYSHVETGLPDIEAQVAFCRAAEDSGIDSLLTDFGYSRPDSILLATALGLFTVAGVVVTGKGVGAHASGFDVPAAVEQQLLGGQVQVAGVAADERRMGGAAWARSVRPLVPTMVAQPR